MMSGAFFGRFTAFAALAAALASGAVYFWDSGTSGGALAPSSAQAAKTTGAMAIGAVSGLPLPRYVSLKADEVNVRGGAGMQYDVQWSYHRAGLPVEITAEWDNWRQVRDAEGGVGWVFHSLLSGRRTALVAPWSKETALPLRKSDQAEADIVAQLQPKVLANVSACTGEWCRISGDGFDGWIQQDQLFGVYPGEQFD